METNPRVLATISACLLLLVGVGGCARAERITLQHAQHQTPVVSRARDIVVRVEVNDERHHLAPGMSRAWGRDVVGYWRNPLGETSDPQFVVAEPVDVTFKRSVEGELSARGVRLEGGTARFRLAIHIETFFNDFKVDFLHQESIADLKINVTLLSSDGNRLYTRRIATQGRCPVVGTNCARLGLEKALDDGIETLFGDWEFASILLSAIE